MARFIYHSALGDRVLESQGAPENDRVDLFTENGVLDIGKCQIGTGVGQCSPVEAEDDGAEGDLESLGIKDLRKRAENLGIDHTDAKKADLVELIRNAESDPQ